MEKDHELKYSHCLNCGATVRGAFCHKCGQALRDNSDRSISRLLGELFSNLFFLDNRLLLSLRYLFFYPGRMTMEFLAGKRKKFISPISLFLFFNLIYFIVNPLSDYSLPLYDQIYSQPYSQLIEDWVINKLRNEGLDGNVYAMDYQTMSDNISKSIMIINVPMIAFLIYLFAFKKRPFYYDSLIFAFHFFSLFMFSWVLLDWVGALIAYLPDGVYTAVSSISLPLFTFVLPFIYALWSMKKWMGISWYWAIPAGFGVLVSVLLANLVYRFLIFLLTFWVT